MTGTDRNTGKPLSGLDHLEQSIGDILTTPIGTRVYRRSYGSRCFEFVDKPLTPANLVLLFQAVAEALGLWEPRLQATQVSATRAGPDGTLIVSVTGTYVPDGTQVQVGGIQIA